MYLFFSRFSKLSARRGNSCFLSLLSVPRYSMAETLPESPGIRFEGIKASALTNLTSDYRGYCSGSARVPVAHAPDDHHDLDFWNVKSALSVQFLAFAAAEAKQPKWWEKKAGPGIPCEVRFIREDHGSSENVQSATISQIICGIKLDNGSVCEKVPVEGRKRCEEHKGMRITS